MREDAARLAMTTTTARGSGGERSTVQRCSSAGGISNRAPDTIIRAVLSSSLKRTARLYDYDHRTLTAFSSATLVRSLSPLACARRSSSTGSGPPPGGALRPVDVRYPPVDASLSHRASTRPRRESALPPPPPREPLALALALAAPAAGVNPMNGNGGDASDGGDVAASLGGVRNVNAAGAGPGGFRSVPSRAVADATAASRIFFFLAASIASASASAAAAASFGFGFGFVFVSSDVSLSDSSRRTPPRVRRGVRVGYALGDRGFKLGEIFSSTLPVRQSNGAGFSDISSSRSEWSPNPTDDDESSSAASSTDLIGVAGRSCRRIAKSSLTRSRIIASHIQPNRAATRSPPSARYTPSNSRFALFIAALRTTGPTYASASSSAAFASCFFAPPYDAAFRPPPRHCARPPALAAVAWMRRRRRRSGRSSRVSSLHAPYATQTFRNAAAPKDARSAIRRRRLRVEGPYER